MQKDISKRLVDILGSLLLIPVFLPLFVLIALAIKLESKGAIFFSQGRLGKNGRVFKMLKFRSMVQNAEQMKEGLFNYKGDPRVTRVGSFLRKTSLDELPQIFNILRGDMSFVGPRPPVTYELGDYKDFDERLKIRFIVKPGITGYAQIRGRNELSWDEKIAHDLEYVRDYHKWGLLLDFKIVLITIVKVITGEGSFELQKNSASDSVRMSTRK